MYYGVLISMICILDKCKTDNLVQYAREHYLLL